MNLFRMIMLNVLTWPMWIGGFAFYGLIFGPWTWRQIRWDVGTVALTWRPWFSNRWGYATTIGYFIGRSSVLSERTRQHERVHVRQAQDNCINGMIAGGFASIWGGWQALLIVWGSAILWPLWDMGIAAVFRNAHPNGYRGSERERSAYAQTDGWTDKETAWLQKHRGASDGKVT